MIVYWRGRINAAAAAPWDEITCPWNIHVIRYTTTIVYNVMATDWWHTFNHWIHKKRGPTHLKECVQYRAGHLISILMELIVQFKALELWFLALCSIWFAILMVKRTIITNSIFTKIYINWLALERHYSMYAPWLIDQGHCLLAHWLIEISFN